MNRLLIDENKCIGCGICIKDCVRSIIELKDGKASLIEGECIGCGHCIAICPENAVSLENLDMSEIIELDGMERRIDPDEFLLSIKSSRSVRQFNEKKVSKDKIEKIIEAGRFTATAQNKQNVSYIVADEEEKIKKIEDMAISEYIKLKDVKDEDGNYILGPYRNMNFKEGFLFKNAPLIIMTKSNHDVNAALATKSMELMAENLGLGVFHVGLFTMRANTSKDLKSILEVDSGENIVTCLAIGYSDIEYKRTVPREKANIKWL